MEKIRNLSLKKTIILYMVISLCCSFILSAFVMRAAESTQERIWMKYLDREKYYNVMRTYSEYIVSVPRVSPYDMSEIDLHISEICDFLETYAVLVFSILGSCISVALFYKNKLKCPIDELHNASKLIAQNELEFQVTYENRDELGQLCREFEKMRAQLAENNRLVWRMMEDERALRVAIAHDIRSPLAVLSGYQEMLLEFVPAGTLNKDKTVEMLQEGMVQIKRMQHFIEMMQKMTKLEERELYFADIALAELEKQIRKEAEIMSREAEKQCEVHMQAPNQNICIDTELVLEVLENLLSNALRYAGEKVEIILAVKSQELLLTVLDDGAGFSEDIELVTQAFYHVNPQDDLSHFGIGMYISQVYCRKHGGRLLTANQEGGGALVQAVFHIE